MSTLLTTAKTYEMQNLRLKQRVYERTKQASHGSKHDICTMYECINEMSSLISSIEVLIKNKVI